MNFPHSNLHQTAVIMIKNNLFSAKLTKGLYRPVHETDSIKINAVKYKKTNIRILEGEFLQEKNKTSIFFHTN